VTLAAALAAATARGLERLDAQLLLLHALGRPRTDRAWLLAHDTDALSDAAQAVFLELCQRRAGAEPVAYIVGRKEFFGLDLTVDRRVLVPRPETETLVEWALELLPRDAGLESGSKLPGMESTWIADQVRNDGFSPRVVDLGTGSGAIALAIKHARPQAVVEAVDCSPDALHVARANARRLGLDVKFQQASWLTGSRERYDLVLGNPPYVAEADPHLAALQHEPLSALAAGTDGLQEIRSIVAQAPSHMLPGGWLVLEHGWDQAEAVRGLLTAAGLHQVSTRRDLAGIERCTGGLRAELG
jgi:release factor glutamine methyltransferase